MAISNPGGGKSSKSKETGNDAKVTRAAAKAQKRKEAEIAEQEEAERISNLPRRSKEKAKQAKLWMTTQNTRPTRGNQAKAIEQTVEGGDDQPLKVATARKKNKKKAGQPSMEPGGSDEAPDAQPSSKRTAKNAGTKQKPDAFSGATRPVLNRALLDDEAHETPNTVALPAKTVVVKPQRNSVGTAKKGRPNDKPGSSVAAGKNKSSAAAARAKKKTSAAAAKHGKLSASESGWESEEDEDESTEESSKESSDDSSLSEDEDQPQRLESDGSREDNGTYNGDVGEEEEDEEDEEDEDKVEDWQGEAAAEVQHLDGSHEVDGYEDDEDSDNDLTVNQGKKRGQLLSAEPESSESESLAEASVRQSHTIIMISQRADNGYTAQAPGRVSATKRKRKQSKSEKQGLQKKQKRLEDRPRMREVAGPPMEPTTSRAVTVAVPRPGVVRSKKGRPCAHHTGRVNQANLTRWEADYHPATRLEYNEKNGINLNSQSEPIKNLGQAIIKKFHHVMTFEHGFFPANKRFQMQRDLVIEVAENLDVDRHVLDRLHNNDLYVKMFTKMADLRNLQFLGKVMKRNAELYVQAQYKLPVVATPEDIANRAPDMTEEQAKRLPTKQHVARLLTSLAFAHSGVTFNAAGKPSVDSDKMLDLPIVGSVLADSYFASDRRGRSSLAASNPNLFKSSDYYNSHEVEVPPSMVGLACAAIGEALRGWSDGVHVRKDLNSTTAEEQYDTCMHLLDQLRTDWPKRYHQIMHNLYVSASGGMPQVLKNSANKEGAVRMIRFVDADQGGGRSSVGATSGGLSHPGEPSTMTA